MDMILSTVTFFAVIILTALPFVWPQRSHKAILLAFGVGIVGYWLSSLIMSGAQVLLESVFFHDAVLDYFPTGILGTVVSITATFIFEIVRYLPLFIVAHLLKDETRLITPAAGAIAVGFWGMMLLRVVATDISAPVLSFESGAPFYLTTVFGVVSFVILGLAVSRSLARGLLILGLLIVLQLLRGNAQAFLPDTPMIENVLLVINGMIVIGLYAIAILLWRRASNKLDTTPSNAHTA